MITFNDQQIEAIRKAIRWYFVDSFNQQCFTLGGLAGVGKTTVVNTIVHMLGLPSHDVIFATLTGKASLVLRLKGNPSNTIHSTFYSVYKSNNSFKFALKKRIASNIRLIILDEASMISQSMIDDIKTFNIPMLLILDPGQVPPIFGSNEYIINSDKLDVFLTQVMRQDNISGILQYATKARNGEPLQLGSIGKSRVVDINTFTDEITKFDAVLCYSNKNRRLLNKLIRSKMGYTSSFPKENEKIVCLMNNYHYELEYDGIPIYIINGLVGYINKDAKEIIRSDLNLLELQFVPDFLRSIKDTNLKFNVVCFKEIFEQYNSNYPEKEAFIEELYNNDIDDDELDDICMIDYGYSITVHKSQGSEYNNVGVFVDFRGKPDEYNKWLYTAITRAKQSVTITFPSF